jgi:hypothetical protein
MDPAPAARRAGGAATAAPVVDEESDDGLGATGDDRVFKRLFSALCLSLIAAADVSAPFLDEAEARVFFGRMLDYFERERDLRASLRCAAGCTRWRTPRTRWSDDARRLNSPRLESTEPDRLIEAHHLRARTLKA